MPQTNELPNKMTGARSVPFSQRWYNAKIIIRVLIFCLCALSLGLSFLSSISLLGPVIIADVAWIFAEIITLAIRRAKKRGIHPIAHLILDILFTIAYFYMVIVYGILMAHSIRTRRNRVAEVFVEIFLVALL